MWITNRQLIWDNMNGATWFMNEKEYVLDYILVNERAERRIKEARILDRDDVESYHAAIEVDIEWKMS